jgi:hypothetical protein
MLTLLHVVQRQDAAHSGCADCAEHQDAGTIAGLGNLLFVVGAFQRDIIITDVFERVRFGFRLRLGLGLGFRLRLRFGLGFRLRLRFGLGFRLRLRLRFGLRFRFGFRL